jgi:hypothetical protein
MGDNSPSISQHLSVNGDSNYISTSLSCQITNLVLMSLLMSSIYRVYIRFESCLSSLSSKVDVLNLHS